MTPERETARDGGALSVETHIDRIPVEHVP
jgi:hypothetical protein